MSHHHHRDKYVDAEVFKNESLKRIRRRKLVSSLLFSLLCVIAAGIILTLVWLYFVV